MTTGHVDLADSRDVADLGTFLTRARRLDASAVRLQASGRVLAVTVCTSAGGGLLGEGTVLGMRALALADEAECDVVVGIDAVNDRLARLRRPSSPVTGEESPQRLELPPVPVVVQWAALSPPRAGWERVQSVAGEVITGVAESGIASVAQSPSGGVRDAAWRHRVPGTELPAGAALAAHALGFVTPEMTLHTCARWQRLSSPVGHVLSR